MRNREDIIRLWFDMWIKKQDLGIKDIFANDIVYTESWGPKYNNRSTLELWFKEWNSRAKVETWDIVQFLDFKDQSIVEWHFKSVMNNGKIDEFNGISLVKWDFDYKIIELIEFGCNIDNYNRYAYGEIPKFRKEKSKWF